MKRIIIAFSLLLTVAALSIAALWQQSVVTAQLLEDCDRLVTVYEAGDIAACRTVTAQFSSQLKERMRLFPFFLHHERMESIFQQAATLPHLINDNDPADYASAISSLKMQLQILMDNEWPVPENIL